MGDGDETQDTDDVARVKPGGKVTIKFGVWVEDMDNVNVKISLTDLGPDDDEFSMDTEQVAVAYFGDDLPTLKKEAGMMFD